METKGSKARGRPRAFDIDEGVAIAQRLFEQRGYDAVSVADLTTAIGINPPSFYAAYGSKAELFRRALARYTANVPPTRATLTPGRPAAEALGELLTNAARRDARDAQPLGCMVIEATRADDAAARDAALVCAQSTVDAIHTFVARTHPTLAAPLSDYMNTVLFGLSAMARAGVTAERLVTIARNATLAVSAMLEGETRQAAAPRRPAVTRAAGRRR